MLEIKDLIPTDTSYFLMRIIKEKSGITESKLKRKYSVYLRYAKYRKPLKKDRRCKSLHRNFYEKAKNAVGYYTPKLIEKDMITTNNSTLFITDLGLDVLNATDKIFFEESPPNYIEYRNIIIKKRRQKRVYVPQGPLTSTFHGEHYGNISNKLLDIKGKQRAIEGLKDKWAPYLGRNGDEEQGIVMKTTDLLRLINRGFLETSVNIGGRAKMCEYELIDDSISNVPEEVIKSFKHHVIEGLYSLKYIKNLRYKLTLFGLKEDTARLLDSPLEAKVLWYISKGYFKTREIAEETGANSSYITDITKKLTEKGLLHTFPIYIRLRLEDLNVRKVILYLEKLDEIRKKSDDLETKLTG